MSYSPAVSSYAVNGTTGHLIVTYDNGATQDIGSVVGATGATGATGAVGATGATGSAGVSVTGAAINSSGQLVLTLSNGSTINAGAAVALAGFHVINKTASFNVVASDFVANNITYYRISAGAASVVVGVDASLFVGSYIRLKRIDNVALNTVTIQTANNNELMDSVLSELEGGFVSRDLFAVNSTTLDVVGAGDALWA